MGLDLATPREHPDWISFQTWQEADDAHPPGGGRRAYRVVFKTLRVIVQGLEIRFGDNLVMRVRHGAVARGGVELPGAFRARTADRWLLPEFGRLVPSGADQFKYKPTATTNFTFTPWQDELEDVFFVEFVFVTPDSTTAPEQLVEGRQKLATLRTMLDLKFGPRFLGVVLAEDVGEVFDDWHFNRSVSSELVGHEFQLDVQAVTNDELAAWNASDVQRYQNRSLEEKQRLRLASQWYSTGTENPDPVIQYLALWFAVEVLLLEGASTNIRPIREFLAIHVGGDESDWAEFVGRHFGRRSAIVHGSIRAVTKEQVASLRLLVEVILQSEIATLDASLSDRLRSAARIGV